MAQRMIQLVFIVYVLTAGLGLAGCGSPGPMRSTVDLAPGQYAEAFDASRAVLGEMGFAVDRVDARAGVVSTQLRATAGLATPWDPQQTGLGDEFVDLVAAHARSVRVTFEPTGLADPDAPQPVDRATADVAIDPDGPLVMRVHAVVWQTQRPGRRIETESIRRSGRWVDPALIARRMQPTYTVPVHGDPDLAARIAQRIVDRIARAGDAPAGG